MKVDVKLKEYLHPEMDLLFVALNAPEVSNSNGHWFSRNLSFWNLLFDAGIITQRILNPLEGDEKVFGDNAINHNNWNIGVTDLNREIVETISAKVETNKDQVVRILHILDHNPTKRLCLMHSKVINEFKKQKLVLCSWNGAINNYGKAGIYKNTEIFIVPFHNAALTSKVSYYRQLIDPTRQVPSTPIAKSKHGNTMISNTTRIGSHFILPDSGNSITTKDINKGTLRITVAFKDRFPSRDSEIEVIINGNINKVSYVKGDGRSDLLKLGKSLMHELDISEGDRLKVTKTDINRYLIEKI